MINQQNEWLKNRNDEELKRQIESLNVKKNCRTHEQILAGLPELARPFLGARQGLPETVDYPKAERNLRNILDDFKENWKEEQQLYKELKKFIDKKD